jgi:multicomponent Na+:H+ antiporter subunit G
MDLIDLSAEVLILIGALFAAIAGWGQVRYDRDVFIRMHFATKPATLGMALALLGAAILAPTLSTTSKLLLAIVLQFVTIPVAAHLVGRAAHQAGEAEGLGQVVDELEGADLPIFPPDA